MQLKNIFKVINNFKIVLFVYNFPHRKSIDFITILSKLHFKISLILAADFVSIESPKSAFVFKKTELTKSAKDLAEKYHIPYYVVKHNSTETKNLLKRYDVNFGIIAGARILHESIINRIKYGVLNFHPGLLPAIRGLDAVLWAIYKNESIGVTAHLITEKIDAGMLICQQKITISLDDNIETIFQKNYQLQLDLIPISLNLLSKNKKLQTLSDRGNYHTKMSYETQLKLREMITHYIKKNHQE